MKREKKYLFILLGFLMAILYLHPVSALAEEAQKITVSYQYIDEDTGEIFREEKRNTDKQAGKAYEATPRWEEKYGLEKKEVVEERIDGDSGTAYMFDLGHSKNVLKIEYLSENSEENVIQLYYKEYHLSDSDHTCVDVTIMDEDADVVIKKEIFEVKKSDHFYYDIDFIIKDEQGISYRYDSQSTENRERVFSANENAMRNQVKLYYKKGSIKPEEAIVVVYKELDPFDTEYCKKQFIEGLTVGDDFYLDDIHVSGQDNDNDLSELRRLYECYYSYDWKLNEKIYIEKLSSNLNDNILKTYHHLYKLRPGDYAEESTKVVLEFVDADTGKAFKTDQRFTSPGAKINYTAVPNKLTASNGNVYYFDKDHANNHLSITAKKIEKGSDVYKAGNVIKAYYFTKKNPGDSAAVRVSYMDSATGKLVRQADKDGLIVGESYQHQPEESFKIGDVTYTYDQENAKNKLQIENLSGHPGKDEIVIYYKASAPDSNQNSEHDSKPNPPKVKKLAAPKKLQAVRTGTTKAKITFKKVKKADGYQISYADNKKFRKAKKMSTGKTNIVLKKLKKNRKYYVRVRAYQKINGAKKYGTYSKVKVIAKR